MQYSTSLFAFLGRGLAALTLGVFVVVSSGCGQETPVTTTRFNAFGTQVDLSLVGVEPHQGREAAAEIQQEFTTLERDWHAWEPGPMGRVNQLLATGETFVAPPSILPLVRIGQKLETLSDGLFNPATGHLTDLWGFHSDAVRSRPPPASKQLRQLLDGSPSMAQIAISGLELKSSNPNIKLDFDNITKGHALDRGVERLRELGIKNALIQAGADARVIGDRSGQPWRLTIRRASGTGVLAIVPMRGDESLVTRAEYDRNFVFKGELFHDIIDPRTGTTARGARSVTVLHQDATTAAAAATALFIAGVEDWHRIAQRMGVRYVLLVDAEGNLHMNPAMAERIEVVDISGRTLLSRELEDETTEPTNL